ncbi:MAG: hypothetical protein KGV50_04330 [Gammaproteobacteria bacterium]|nr:hypothetical protein [Gammaproteobacteria bacterium]
MPLKNKKTEYLNDDHTFVVCCFFTENYRIHANSLKESLDKFNLSYYFECVEDTGDWASNTLIKPHFIKKCLNQFNQKAILYLDADAVVKKPIDIFNTATADIMIYPTEGAEGMSHDYLAGTIFLNNTDNSKKLVDLWIDEQQGSHKKQVDQDSLDRAMHKLKGHITFEGLAAGYVKIFDRDHNEEVYIEHYQASRKTKKIRYRRKIIRNRIVGALLITIIVGLVIILK